MTTQADYLSLNELITDVLTNEERGSQPCPLFVSVSMEKEERVMLTEAPKKGHKPRSKKRVAHDFYATISGFVFGDVVGRWQVRQNIGVTDNSDDPINQEMRRRATSLRSLYTEIFDMLNEGMTRELGLPYNARQPKIVVRLGDLGTSSAVNGMQDLSLEEVLKRLEARVEKKKEEDENSDQNTAQSEEDAQEENEAEEPSEDPAD